MENFRLPNFGARQSLRDHIIEVLRSALVSGQMKPGELYSAPTLAEEFGVSATPVREAMLDLVAEGHFEVERNKGFRVRNLTSEELDDLAELRLLVEPPLMRLIGEAAKDNHILADKIADLRPLANAIVRYAADTDLLSYIEADTEFHSSFLELHGNSQAVEIVRNLRTRSRLFGLKELSLSGGLQVMAAEHVKMVDLGVAGKGDELAELTRVHIGHVRQEWAGHAGEH